MLDCLLKDIQLLLHDDPGISANKLDFLHAAVNVSLRALSNRDFAMSPSQSISEVVGSVCKALKTLQILSLFESLEMP